MPSEDTAWVTLATNDGYAVGALVLAHSLKAAGTVHKLHILYTDGVSDIVRRKLDATFDASTLVNVLDSNDTANLQLIGRPDLGVTFTKLHCWRLTQYKKAVFLDADTLVLRNADELFERPDFAAAADIGWPDYFNSGVFVFAPSDDTYAKLVEFGVHHGTFDGGDQGLLNLFYADWHLLDAAHRLPFVYNVTSGAIYSYAAALKRNSGDIKIVHFLGQRKPWHSAGDQVHVTEHLAYWQWLFQRHVREGLPSHLVLHGSGFPPPRVWPPPKSRRSRKRESISMPPEHAHHDPWHPPHYYTEQHPHAETTHEQHHHHHDHHHQHDQHQHAQHHEQHEHQHAHHEQHFQHHQEYHQPPLEHHQQPQYPHHHVEHHHHHQPPPPPPPPSEHHHHHEVHYEPQVAQHYEGHQQQWEPSPPPQPQQHWEPPQHHYEPPPPPPPSTYHQPEEHHHYSPAPEEHLQHHKQYEYQAEMPAFEGSQHSYHHSDHIADAEHQTTEPVEEVPVDWLESSSTLTREPDEEYATDDDSVSTLSLLFSDYVPRLRAAASSTDRTKTATASLKPRQSVPLSRSSSQTSLASSLCTESCSSTGDSHWERRYEDWERGAIDYQGRDSFDNILKQIQKSLGD